MANNPNYVSGTSLLYPSRFVIIASTSDYAKVQHALGSSAGGSTTPIIGVTQPGTKYTPSPGVTSTVCAEVGDMVQVFGMGESDVPILLGAQSGLAATTGVLAGDLLTASTCAGDYGAACTCPTSQILSGTSAIHAVWYGARALQSGVAGEIIRCQIIQGSIGRTTA